ncbi:histidinol dehydrogenase [Algoriphagus namhaensis]|uniref:Histidinol dehydrogenase n=1 Tax=Algoriphagus namhaensis TaxID=915353 RepID=A0ABV8AX95_9BACT
MKILRNPDQSLWKRELKRPTQSDSDIGKIIRPIFKSVKKHGDKALKHYALEFDQVKLDEILVTEQEINEAVNLVSEELKEAIEIASANISKFHTAQKQAELVEEVMPGVVCSRKSVPIQRVGLYIPGGTAPLFSTVLMLGIPAVIAGCSEIILCSPPNKEGKIHPAILYTASLIGLKKIAKVGGAQAIAAMTFGTKSIPAVDKIFGPGNQFVTAGKQRATKYGVAIDMPAGPSEVLVYADDSAVPEFVAADLLSQAEHGVDSQVVLVTTSEAFAKKTLSQIDIQLKNLSRKAIAKEALTNSKVVIMERKEKALDLINFYAPEHLIISVKDEDKAVNEIYNAGSVFIGNYTPESAGDYASGTNHTLPTYGYARNYSGVSLDSFVKKITYQKISKSGLKLLGPTIEIMAANELLDAHKNAVTVRLKRIIEEGNEL